MIQPVNGHLLIDPIKHEGFIATQSDTYEEVGIVKEIAKEISLSSELQVGDKVYFDSWLAAKFPNGKDFYWMVKWEDIRAIEHVE